MALVIDLAAFRDGRARERKGFRSYLADGPKPGQIIINLQPDGTHAVTLRGAYATSLDLSVEAMAESIVFLMEERREGSLDQ